jgi:2-keto-4-pentenoate hydratase/2-oxohepta-3-ene-1,7-dioic acid hydratase in catechol pathway
MPWITFFGYTCMNDVSQRNIQNSDRTGWYRGKSLDTFGPIGPQVVLARDLPDPQNLNICCRLNGTTVQEGNTRQMIFKIPEIIAFVSKNFTLMPGDIILTGTPAGVGPLESPWRHRRSGDRTHRGIEKHGNR